MIGTTFEPTLKGIAAVGTSQVAGMPLTVSVDAGSVHVGVRVMLDTECGTDNVYTRTDELNAGCSVPELNVNADSVASLVVPSENLAVAVSAEPITTSQFSG